MARATDNVFGAVAVEWGFCSAEEIEECLNAQHELAERGEKVPRLGELLAHKGFMTPDQVRAVLDGQHRQAEGLFGEIAVRWKFCTQEQVDEALRGQKERDEAGERHARIGEILHAAGQLKKHQVRAILQAQRKKIAVCSGCGKRFNVAGYEYGAKLRCADCGTVTILRQDPREAKRVEEDDIEVAGTVFIPKKDLPVKEEPRLAIGGYEVYSKLGADATGTICKARHLESAADVALKIMHAAAMQDPAFLNRFIEEGKLATSLDHPSLKKLYEVGVEEGRYFYSTEYVEGASIRRIIESGRLFTPVQALDVAIQIASAIEYAHSRGVVHGDLRPSNILITVDGQVKIDGMGMAKDVAGNLRRLAATGETLPLYLAPELAVNPDRPEPAADIYSTGAVLYHMLTGQPPYKGESPLEVLMRVSEETPASVHERNPDVPPFLSGIVSRMLSPEVKDRQESAADLLLELRAAHEKMRKEAEKGVHGTPAKAMAPVASLARGAHEVQPTVRGMPPVSETIRHRVERRESSSAGVWIAVALVVGAIGAAGVVFMTRSGPVIGGGPPPEERPTEPERPKPNPILTAAEKKLEAEYRSLVEYRDANPDDPEMVYGRYQRFLADYENSQVGKAYVQQAVAQAKELRRKTAEAVYEKARDNAREYLAMKNFSKAMEGLREFLDDYGEAEAAGSARTFLRKLGERQSEAYRNARQKAENYVARGKIADAKGLLREIADGYTEQFADPARKRLAELDAAQAPVPQPPAPEPEKPEETAAQQRINEEAAERALAALKPGVRDQIKIFGFQKAASMAAAGAARHTGTTHAKEMLKVERDVEVIRSLIKAYVDRINSGAVKGLAVKHAGKKLPVRSATELALNLRDRTGLSFKVAWHRIDAEEANVMLLSLVDKKSGKENLALGLLYHYRDQAGWAKVRMAAAKRLGEDTSRLEELILAAEKPAAEPQGPAAGPAAEVPKATTTVYAFDDAKDLAKFEKVAGTWAVERGALKGTGDPASLQMFAEELTELSGRARFDKLDCTAQIAAGGWLISFNLAQKTVVFSGEGGKRREISFPPAANTWYDWAVRMERKDANTVHVGFYLGGKLQASFGDPQAQSGRIYFMVDRNGTLRLDNVRVTARLGGTPAPRQADAGDVKRFRSAGWRIVSGEWSMDTDGVITGRSKGGKPAEATKAVQLPFQLGVSVKGTATFAGVSFGPRKDFGVGPSDKWRKISIKAQFDVDFTIDNLRQWGAGDHTAVVRPGNLGDTAILKVDGGVAEFKGFDVMPLK